VPTSILLAPWFRNYALDFPGFGLSDKPRSHLRVPQYAAWLAAWIRARRLKNVALVGNSFGCQIVADCAMRYPELVSCTVHIGPTTDPKGQSVREQVRRWQQNNPGEPFTHKLVSYRDYWDCGIPRVLQAFRSQLADRIEHKLSHIKVPSLIVRGSNDPIVPQRWAEEATRLLPKGRLVVIPGAFHTINFSSPLELIRVMVPFLAEVNRGLVSHQEAA
jgi:pimeloyl-ACP methyl ester carboxylesterase